MQNSKQFDEAEGVFKRHGRRRTRKSHWRQRWITLSKGARLDRRAILQTMRGPKLLPTAMSRVPLKEEFLQRPRSAESEFGLKFEPPALRVEMEDFIGWSTAAGIDARVAEKEFFKKERILLEQSPRVKDKSYPASTSENSTVISSS